MYPRSAYVHIPFCRRRCYYCDFPISVVGDKSPVGGGDRINGRNSRAISHYVEVVCQEIRQLDSLGKPLKTVFFGGGTPSLLAVEQLHQILVTLDQQFGIVADAEISMEVDPGTFDLEQIQGYRSAGVNRVSLGVQAFQPELLAVCGRSHTVAEIYTAIDWIQQAGFTNISLDLISGLPYQTLEYWQDSLEKAIALAPTHLSCYDLTIESVTPFGRQYKPGISPLPSDATTAEMYRMAQRTLTAAGYEHYEISNYARPGYQCRHNRVYWENRPFYGFGMGATSYVGGDRVARPRKTGEYYEWVEKGGLGIWDQRSGIRDQGLDIGDWGLGGEMQNAKCKMQNSELKTQNLELRTSDLLLETLMLGLRLREGLELGELIERFGEAAIAQVWQCLSPYIEKGWVVGPEPSFLPLPTTGRIRLTDPEGFLFSNVVLTDIFEVFD
ncbi:radical SAM family heme chaperone HemW [Leptodesmis sp.]|uniref:radical SAM family heme chaperone HemW n=1 Tax=Leptodesmis sp. TaxID=3100501 RepID=UPI0040534AE0